MKLTKDFSKSLSKSSFALLAFGLILSALVSTGLGYLDKKMKFESEIKTLSQTISEFFISGDIISLRRTLENSSKSSEWQSGFFIDSDKNEIWKFEQSKKSWSAFQINLDQESRMSFSDVELLGTLKVSKRITLFDSILTRKFLFFVFYSLLFWGTFSFLGNRIFQRIVHPINSFSKSIFQLAKDNHLSLSQDKNLDEIAQMKIWFHETFEKFKESQRMQSEIQKKESLNQMASQVAHDIRSPLAALSAIETSLSELPEQKRILIRESVRRINDIANNLMSTYRSSHESKPIFESDPSSLSKNQLTSEFLAPIVDSLVSEKRAQFANNSKVQIIANLNESYGLFAKVNPIEFRRVLSNLINNSVEAFKDKSGMVLIRITSDKKNKIQIIIQDNGCGIPENIISRLGNLGVSFGKENTDSGSGLGIYHAKKTIESFGGLMKIQSYEGKGTTITLELHQENVPSWFVDSLDLTDIRQIISLDDDSAIHEVWDHKFLQEVEGTTKLIRRGRFQSGIQLKEWLQTENPKNLQSTLFLCDYELLGQKQNGLDWIQQLNLHPQAILVTSRYEEPILRSKCQALNVKLIPKTMAGLVPIHIQTKQEVS